MFLLGRARMTLHKVFLLPTGSREFARGVMSKWSNVDKPSCQVWMARARLCYGYADGPSRYSFGAGF
jgi:hypothetical protein